MWPSNTLLTTDKSAKKMCNWVEPDWPSSRQDSEITISCVSFFSKWSGYNFLSPHFFVITFGLQPCFVLSVFSQTCVHVCHSEIFVSLSHVGRGEGGAIPLCGIFHTFPALPLPISLGPDKFLDMLSCYNYLQLFPNLQLINPIASVINFPRLRECLELEMLRYVSPFPFLPVSCLPVHR